MLLIRFVPRMQIKDKGLLGLNFHHCSGQRWFKSESKGPFSFLARLRQKQSPTRNARRWVRFEVEKPGLSAQLFREESRPDSSESCPKRAPELPPRLQMVKGGRGVASEAQSKPIIPAMGFREVRIIGEKVGKLMLTNSIHFFKEVFMFKLVFATMLFVVVGCASPTAVKSSDTANLTIKMGCYKSVTVCPDVVNHDTDIIITHDTALSFKKGIPVYIIWIYDLKNDIMDRSDYFVVEHDTIFDYSSPLNPN